MDKALGNLIGKNEAGGPRSTAGARLDWRRKMSDHIAYALLAYTGLQIFVTMSALKTTSGSIMPYFALVILVAAIIPGCRLFEKRWEVLSDEEAADPALASQFRRDRLFVWIAALGLPFLITGLLKGLAYII